MNKTKYIKTVNIEYSWKPIAAGRDKQGENIYSWGRVGILDPALHLFGVETKLPGGEECS